MKSSEPDHTTLATRIAEILLKLNLNESFAVQDLADEYGVNERTIYRDLNRLGGIVDKLPDGRYQLAPEYRGKLTTKDLESFAKLAGVSDLFPNLSPRFLVAVLDTLSQSSFLVKGHRYEQAQPNDQQFTLLDKAIREQRLCCLTYADKRRTVAPYRLINTRGIWYLAATENGMLKAFTLGRLSSLNMMDDTFTADAAITLRIETEDDVWFTSEKTEVILRVDAQIAYYFLRRNLLPQQELVKKLESGGLVLSCQISHVNQILPLVQYWIPRISIVEPAWLKGALESQLRAYLQ